MKLTLKNKVLAGLSALFVVALVATAAYATDTATLYVSSTAPETIDGDLGTVNNPYPTLQAAVTAAHSGDTVVVSGTQTVTSTITIDKAITIDGMSKAGTILTNGTSQTFLITGAGATIKGLTITKTDAADQNIIGVQANDVSITDNAFTGTFAIGDGQVSRAMVISPGTTGYTVSGNTISNLRQPAYIDASTGTVSNNTVSGTKGWVVLSDSNTTFSGNTWGTNVEDIAIIPGVTNNYTDILALSAANANAEVENQFGTPILTTVYVDGSVATSGNGTPLSPYKTMAGAVNRVVTGGTITLASNVTATEAVVVSKSLTINGGGYSLNATFEKTDAPNNAAITVLDTSNVTIKDLIVDGTGSVKIHGINVVTSTNVNLNTVTVQNTQRDGLVVNGSTVNVSNITTANNAWGGIDVDQGSGITAPATLTISGTSAHTEIPAIIKDDNAKAGVTVTGSLDQYVSANYTHDTSVTGTTYTLKTVKVDTLAGLKAALANNLVSTIIFANDITVATSQVSVDHAVTIDGAGHKLFGSFAKTDGSNNSALAVINTSGVTIKDLVEDGTSGTNLHGINVYGSTDVTLNNVTVSNNQHNGLSINGSSVTLTGITTSNNGWGGIDIDQPNGVTSPVVLTISGTMHQSESVLDIFRDNDAKDVTLVDPNNLYVATSHDNGNSTTGTIWKLIDQKEISNTNPILPVTSSTQPINVTVDSAATNPKIDVSSLVMAGSGTGTLPQISVLSDNVNVNIAAGTTVTSTGLTTWNGVINAPIVTNAYTLPSVNNVTTTAVLGIEVGAGDTPLVFSNPVKLTFAGQANNLIGWSQGGTFHAIDAECDSATAPTLAAGADCRINSGSDLIVWTKHFTTFVTYTQASNGTVVSGGGGGGGSSGGSVAVAPTVTTPAAAVTAPVGQVLGAESFNFTLSLSNGAKGDEVMQLQTRLNADGATLTVDGKFGPKTKAALMKWQKSHKLSADGKVGPKTRAALNAQ